MRLVTWIPIVVLVLLLGVAWVALRSEHPLTLAFDEPPAAGVLTDPVAPGGELTIARRVLGEGGRPVRDALVQMHLGPRLMWTHTDAEGRFQIAGVDAGPHRLTVVGRGFLPVEFDVVPGGEPADLVLQRPVPTPPQVPATGRTDLSVTLSSASGGALGRFELHLVPESEDVRASATFPRWVTFDEEGRCAVPQLAHGRYRARVLPGWARGGSWPDLLTELDGPGRVFDHPGDGEWALELRAGEIRGRITDGARRAERRVEFVAGALVLVRPVSGGELPDARIWPPAESDEQGAFLVPDLPPGRYVVTVHTGDRRLEREVSVYPAATTTLDL